MEQTKIQKDTSRWLVSILTYKERGTLEWEKDIEIRLLLVPS